MKPYQWLLCSPTDYLHFHVIMAAIWSGGETVRLTPKEASEAVARG